MRTSLASTDRMITSLAARRAALRVGRHSGPIELELELDME
jgi:hypothetical protein